MKIHFLGIGGIGMSAQALHEHFRGNEVTGTDPYISERVKYLKHQGIKVFHNHKPENIDDTDLIVRTPAVSEDNPEVKIAKERKIPVITRLQHHIQIMKDFKRLGVTGTDGKTTTTSMLAHVLLKLGMNPTVFLGSTHPELEHGNYRKGGNLCVFEMDESQPGFSDYAPEYLIVTNIRGDHIENFKNYEEYIENFKSSCSKAKLCISNAEENILRKTITFGIEKGNYHLISVEKKMYNQFIKISTPFGNKRFKLSVPGTHNILNALAVIALTFEMGLDQESVLSAFGDYVLPGRRFQISYDDGEIIIIDDYSHTPVEIESLLKTAREVFNGKEITVIFQPHRYTRLKREWKDFAKSLTIADNIFITEVYGAFEEKDGISAKNVAELIDNALFVGDKENILKYLKVKPGVYIFAGAGDIINVSKIFKNMLGGLRV
ncbi:UDP-N-acetylmuramate--L-alanine ligase [Thermosipho atlanticus]|uniref:UDP-N-acetylmuramate--L-alanine ligase n=1 Tax=Thermosipho atlanticus DSM 15807 TaxID=1123380 RepID=A0A1M5T408_9BACT|nr:UDP-N-acetylmuramate--L-alanine ligase [Thermosipho atlanticus]SHH45479.1 UDP-N-acetylmuramate--L-alanine ligase [Thermosipho atlanticus DSM 15807]